MEDERYIRANIYSYTQFSWIHGILPTFSQSTYRHDHNITKYLLCLYTWQKDKIEKKIHNSDKTISAKYYYFYSKFPQQTELCKYTSHSKVNKFLYCNQALECTAHLILFLLGTLNTLSLAEAYQSTYLQNCMIKRLY